MAEIEQSVAALLALGRRFSGREVMAYRTTAWQEGRNTAESTIDWQFTTGEAPVSLDRLHPKIDDWHYTKYSVISTRCVLSLDN